MAFGHEQGEPPERVGGRGGERPLTLEDILIVLPYNAQVRCLKAAMPEARIGTVDKFQGQEAPVVFFSMTSSSGDDVPRGLDFLFSKNRLNVAISRAQALAVVVCSPALLHSRCRTVGDMQLISPAVDANTLTARAVGRRAHRGLDLAEELEAATRAADAATLTTAVGSAVRVGSLAPVRRSD